MISKHRFKKKRIENGKRKVGKKSIRPCLLILALLLVIPLILLRGEQWLKRFLIYMSHASWGRQIASSLPLAKKVSRRFVAGETIDDAMAAALAINNRGMTVTLDYLGESVIEAKEAELARDEILRLFDQIYSLKLDANVSVKLTQLGLRIDPGLALKNLGQILAKASTYNNRVRIDMEESDLVDATLDLYRVLRDESGFDNVGIVIQSYLYRSDVDVLKLISEGAWIRLCKGAYAEPAEVAYPNKADTDSSYIKLTKMMLSSEARLNGVYLGIATHDEKMINSSLQYIREQRIQQNEFEFQMLFGIRRDLQDDLTRQGYQVRIYVPYGTAWYPYLVRRLAERPANLWFFASNLFKR
jgi:proline dehydrogenase